MKNFTYILLVGLISSLLIVNIAAMESMSGSDSGAAVSAGSDKKDGEKENISGVTQEQVKETFYECMSALTDSSKRDDACHKSAFLASRVIGNAAGKAADAFLNVLGAVCATAGALTGFEPLNTIGKYGQKKAQDCKVLFTKEHVIITAVVIGLSVSLASARICKS